VHYRLYTPQDFDRLYALEEACFEIPFRFDRRYMRQLVNRSSTVTWIAEEAGEMVGFAIVESSDGRSEIRAYIQTLEVSPGARCRGVGRELLQRLESSALDAGARRIWLHVEAENTAAIQLYESQRYSRVGRQEDYYPLGRAALIFMKSLKAESAS
jgi:ribosomal protein S18 acetylase RimI-like enzyme